MPTNMQPRQLAQEGMDLDPGPVAAPLPKIVLHRPPGALLAWHIAPGAAGAQDGEDASGDTRAVPSESDAPERCQKASSP